MRPTRRGSGEEKHWFTLFHPYYSPLTPNMQPGYYFCICMTFSHLNLALWGLDLKSLILKVSKHTGVCVRTLWVFISRNRDDCNSWVSESVNFLPVSPPVAAQSFCVKPQKVVILFKLCLYHEWLPKPMPVKYFCTDLLFSYFFQPLDIISFL